MGPATISLGLLCSRNDLHTASHGLAAQMVQQLNLILLTTPEAIELRSRLKQSTASAEGATLFQTLYPAWSHNPVALLSMCLLAQARPTLPSRSRHRPAATTSPRSPPVQLHEHASELVLQFAEIEISVAFLLQIDKLVQLVESPIFTHVRLQLLEPDQHPFLLKAPSPPPRQKSHPPAAIPRQNISPRGGSPPRPG